MTQSGVLTQSTHNGVGNQTSCSSGFQRFGQRQGATEKQNHLQVNGLERRFLTDDPSEHQEGRTDAGGDLKFDADLLLKNHGEYYHNEHHQGGGLLPSGNAAVVGLILSAALSLGVGKEPISDKYKVEDTDDQHGCANGDVLEETCLNTQVVQRVNAHQIAGSADDGQVST